MKLSNKSRLTKAKSTGGVVGVTLAALAVVAGIGVMIAAPIVGGVAVGLAVAGALPGAGGVICGILAGFVGASVAGSIGVWAGLGVMAVGAGVAGAVGAAVNGAGKLLGKVFGIHKAAPKAAQLARPADATSSFKVPGATVPFAEAARLPAGNDNKVAPQLQKAVGQTPKL